MAEKFISGPVLRIQPVQSWMAKHLVSMPIRIPAQMKVKLFLRDVLVAKNSIVSVKERAMAISTMFVPAIKNVPRAAMLLELHVNNKL